MPIARQTSSRGRARTDFRLQRGKEFGERLGAEVAFAAMTHRDGASFGFFCADDQHVRHFLHLRVANFRGELFIALVEVDADVVALQRFGYVFGVVDDFFADRPAPTCTGASQSGNAPA